MSNLYLEDCRETMKRKDLKYDYIFCGPPDFDELGWSPDTHMEEYFKFLESVFKMFKPDKHAVTIAITDRKYDAGIIEKHAKIIAIIRSLGYKYVSQKIWKKSDKLNLYRLNYSFVMSFANGKIKQRHPKEYEYDIWDIENDKYEGYSYGFPTNMVERALMNFTEENDIVYDCFAGSCTTGMVCKNLKRKFIGSEIDKKTHELGIKRLKENNLFS